MSPKTVYCKDKSRVHFLTQNLLELIFRLGVGNVCFGFTQGCKLVKQDFHEKPIFFAPFLKWLLLCCSKIRKMLVKSGGICSCQHDQLSDDNYPSRRNNQRLCLLQIPLVRQLSSPCPARIVRPSRFLLRHWHVKFPRCSSKNQTLKSTIEVEQ